MSVHDPIADALTIIRNGAAAGKASVEMPFSNKVLGIAEILKEEGYVSDVKKVSVRGKSFERVKVDLKYKDKKSVIEGLKRISKPGLRIYASVKEMPRVYNGLGTAIISTSKGIVSDQKARRDNVGGEVICYVW